MSTTNAFVWITTQFEGFHAWEGAPSEVSFLRARHRHIFHIMMEVQVTHDDRDVEFILLKRKVDDFINLLEEPLGSCEMIARAIGCHFIGCGYNVSQVTVSEDGENGARIEW